MCPWKGLPDLSPPSQPAQAAVTEHHRQAACTTNILPLTALEAWSLRPSAGRCTSGESTLFLASRQLSSNDGERERALLSLPLLKRALIPLLGPHSHGLN